METIILIAIIVTAAIAVSIKDAVIRRLNAIDGRLERLSHQLAELEKKKAPLRQEDASQEAQKVEHRPKPIQPERVREPEIKPAVPPVVDTPIPAPQPPNPVPSPMPEREPQRVKVATVAARKRNEDLEKFIGENLANKIGIGILVLGIGYFVKYAIDQQWINEIGRVFIGILAGGILLAIAHRLRKTFSAFSSVLVGGGIAVLYFTIGIAFHEYHIFNQVTAFVLMVGITAFTVVLSLGYNRVELAVLAILGGFGSPFMVSTGEGNYVVLFTYMLILNGGMLVLAFYKRWKIINVICYLFTILIFGTWVTTRFDASNLSMIRGALVFATMFYFIFFAMNIVSNIRERAPFEGMQFFILLSNTFLYFAAGLTLLNNSYGEDFKGLFTTLLAVFNFIFAYTLYKKLNVDRNLVFMLIGLVLTFISLAAPIQLEGNYITLFWSAEAVLLLWLAKKSGIRLIKLASVLVMALMAISLVMDWSQIYFNTNAQLALIFNKGYVTSVVSVISGFLTLILLKGEKDDPSFKTADYRLIVSVLTVGILYISNLLELRHQLYYENDSFTAQELVIGAYNMFFILMILVQVRRIPLSADAMKLTPLLGIVAMLSYLIYYHQISVQARTEFMAGTSSALGFGFHYLVVGLAVVISVITLKRINVEKAFTESIANSQWWLFIFFFVFIASAELDHTVVLGASPEGNNLAYVVNQNHKIGYPILWGVSSFVLIAFGLQRKIKVLRIISLALLLITLLKLFLVDLKGISKVGMIAAFISLGILLLVVSFMYQRLKRLLLEDTETETQGNS